MYRLITLAIVALVTIGEIGIATAQVVDISGAA
jgi:hypothetical protein